jgi:hypothetical protein
MPSCEYKGYLHLLLYLLHCHYHCLHFPPAVPHLSYPHMELHVAIRRRHCTMSHTPDSTQRRLFHLCLDGLNSVLIAQADTAFLWVWVFGHVAFYTFDTFSPAKNVLEGHNHSMNCAIFHPIIPLIISATDDKTKILRISNAKAQEVDWLRHILLVFLMQFLL